MSLSLNDQEVVWITGNQNKVFNLNATLALSEMPELKSFDFDCREVLASPATVARYKAMMAYTAVVPAHFKEGSIIMIEDTSLDLDGVADWDPTLIKNNIARLPGFVGTKASWTSCIAMCDGKYSSFTTATVHGTICEKVPGGFGFDPYFVPDGSSVTFGQDPAPKYNPRFLALMKFLKEGHGKFPIPYDPKFEKNWGGGWQ
jgi:inosine/xanthosine triphosphate pyrophosphatase family protein